MVGLERELPFWILEERAGRVFLNWDDLWLTVRAEGRRREELCKLWLQGERGALLLGTMAPEGRWQCLCRRFTLRQVNQAGAWPPVGVTSALRFPYDPGAAFPLPEVFCFARVEQGTVCLRFDEQGRPVMPVAEGNETIPRK